MMEKDETMTNSKNGEGFTKITNHILEQMAKTKLSPMQYRIIFVVWRYTFGFHRKEHKLSLNFIAEATGCERRNIQRDLVKLENRNIITQSIKYGSLRRITFNPNFASSSTVVRTANGETYNSTVRQTNNKSVVQIANKERKKEKYKETGTRSVYEHYMTLELRKHRTYTVDMKTAIERAMQKNKYDIDYCKTLLDRHKQAVEATKKNDKPIQLRGLTEFFGQRVHGGTHLICADYEEGGRYYEKYCKPNDKPQVRFTGKEISYKEAMSRK